MKSFWLGFLIITVIFGGMFFLIRGNLSTGTDEISGNNVTMVDGVQIIEIRAKGGYQPRVSLAKSGVPTILRFNTKGTFDCSSSIRIPSLNISKNLVSSGSTDVELGIQSSGTLKGSCGMGMYPFEVQFQG